LGGGARAGRAGTYVPTTDADRAGRLVDVMAPSSAVPRQAPQPRTRRGSRLERRGVEYVPPELRSSRPRRIFVVFFGASLSIMIAVYGGLMVEFGLSLWAAMSAVLVGNLVGLLFVCPMILLGPRTGTNNQISSSAHYGILGRLIGSGISLATTLIFGAVAI